MLQYTKVLQRESGGTDSGQLNQAWGATSTAGGKTSPTCICSFHFCPGFYFVAAFSLTRAWK
jgi:hypothetical protein